MSTRLSFPPEASKLLSHDHFKPQIYCWCPQKRMQLSLYLMSQIIISLSLEPEAISLPDIEISITPTRPKWFLLRAASFRFYTSISLIRPVSSPTASPLPHFTLDMYPSTNFSASLPLEGQIQTALSRTTLMTSSLLQSSKVVQKSSLRRGALSTLQDDLGKILVDEVDYTYFCTKSVQKSKYPPLIILDL